MLTAVIVVPLAGALLLALWRPPERPARWSAIGIAAVPLVLMIVAWLRFETGSPVLFQLVEEAEWMPAIGASYRIGVDGIGLGLAAMTAVLFVAAVAYPVDTKGRPHQYYAWMLFLAGASLGLFLSLDLILFYVFFDLTLVGMYFLIGEWGHGSARRSALKFFLYTFVGSLSVLLAILGLYLAAEPSTFDMQRLIESQPLAREGVSASLILFGFMFGFGIKTPLVPVHTWLPPAHVDAPAPASTILAGVLLKIGTFGMIRIPLSMMKDTFQEGAVIIAIVAGVSIVYGALVAFGQRNLKARIAYTSVAHMGIVVLGIAAAGGVLTGDETSRDVALSGAVVGMISHGLITGALFLIAGSFWRRAESYDMDAFGGLASRAPRLTAAAVVASFGGLGLPGLLQFIADFQVFAGSLGVFPVIAIVSLVGLLIMAALFLQLLQDVFFGEMPDRWSTFPDLDHSESIVLGGLLVLSVVLGVVPGFLLNTFEPAIASILGTG